MRTYAENAGCARNVVAMHHFAMSVNICMYMYLYLYFYTYIHIPAQNHNIIANNKCAKPSRPAQGIARLCYVSVGDFAKFY